MKRSEITENISMLKADRHIALALLDHLRLSEGKVAEELAEELKSKLKGIEELSLSQISKELKVHEY